jgi:hypothetical protein
MIIFGCANGLKSPPASSTNNDIIQIHDDTQSVMSKEFEGAPTWITKGCAGYLMEKNGLRAICGVGSVSGNKNPSDARTIAIIKARAEIARTLQTNIMSILSDYNAKTIISKTDLMDEQQIIDISIQITHMTIPGSEPIEFWISKRGTLYALVVLDELHFKESLGNLENIPKNVRQAIVENSDKSFNELDEEIHNQSVQQENVNK